MEDNDMFLQILYAVVKGLLEMEGFQVTPVKPAPADDKADCCQPDQPNH